MTLPDLRVLTDEDDGMWGLSETTRSAEVSDLIDAVRAGVESGTIEEEVVKWCEAHHFRRVFQETVQEPDGICAWKAWVPHKLEPPSPCRIVERLIVGPIADDGKVGK